MSAENEDDIAAANWIRSRPPNVRHLMRRFPPFCRVQAIVPLVIPAPGTIGVVVSYGEPVSGMPDGWIGVAPLCDIEGLRAQCVADQLEVINYAAGWTPERVNAVLSEKVQP